MGDFGDRHYQKLPPGWDCKYDQTTGNCYYINYITKAMQLHDPRYRPLQNERCSSESIAMQSILGPGGSPYHVYPSNNMPAIRAFQTPNSSLHHMSTSPLLTSSRTLLINDMSPLPVQKSQFPQAPRTVNMSRRSTIQETSFSNQIDTDAVVHKIQNMFPTASENHIRLLLKKYYNREAVVISALQVEKHPVTMPGPFVTPPGQRHLFHSNSTVHMTPPARRFDTGSHLRGIEMGAFNSGYSRTASPVPPGRLGSVMSVNSGNIGPLVLPPFHGSPCFGDQLRNSPKPHSSPKMKLRYMKIIFPKADETLLLDVLANSENNVQKASESVMSLGYTKKEFVPQQKTTNRPHDENADRSNQTCEEVLTIPSHPKEYTEEEKTAIKHRLQQKYPQIVEHVVLMALESVNYVEDRAVQILQVVRDEEEVRAKNLCSSSHGITGFFESGPAQGVEAPDGVGGGRFDRSKTAALKTTAFPLTDQITINDEPEYGEGNEADATDNDQSALSLRLNLSSVTMPTKSILDRYRSNSNVNADHYIRGTCASTTFCDKLSPHSRDKSDSLKHSHRDCGDASTEKLSKDFKSLVGRIQINGPNYNLAKGANESLLLADYVTWNGANPDFYQGQRNLAIGSNSSLLSEHTYKACGQNPQLCKGRQTSLVKGSIYNQQNTRSSKTINIKCN